MNPRKRLGARGVRPGHQARPRHIRRTIVHFGWKLLYWLQKWRLSNSSRPAPTLLIANYGHIINWLGTPFPNGAILDSYPAVTAIPAPEKGDTS